MLLIDSSDGACEDRAEENMWAAETTVTAESS
jgi:hypothetical protein